MFFLEFPGFLHDPMVVGNLTSGSSAAWEPEISSLTLVFKIDT